MERQCRSKCSQYSQRGTDGRVATTHETNSAIVLSLVSFLLNVFDGRLRVHPVSPANHRGNLHSRSQPGDKYPSGSPLRSDAVRRSRAFLFLSLFSEQSICFCSVTEKTATLRCLPNRCEDGECGTSGFSVIRKPGFVVEFMEVISVAEGSDNVFPHQV